MTSKQRQSLTYNQHEALASPDVVTGTLSLYGFDVHVLFDLGATHSFVSWEFITKVCITLVLLKGHLEVTTPVRESLWPSQMLKGSLLFVEGQVMTANLIVLDLYDVDVILWWIGCQSTIPLWIAKI